MIVYSFNDCVDTRHFKFINKPQYKQMLLYSLPTALTAIRFGLIQEFTRFEKVYTLKLESL